MFCAKCGNQILEGEQFCSNCGQKVGVSSLYGSSAPQAASVFQGSPQEAGEITIKKGLCSWCKSALVVQNGKAVLTNKRFIYHNSMLTNFAVNVAIGNMITKTGSSFEIPIPELIGIREGRQALNKTIVLQTRGGEEFNCFFYHREEWIAEFLKLIQG